MEPQSFESSLSQFHRFEQSLLAGPSDDVLPVCSVAAAFGGGLSLLSAQAHVLQL